MNSNPIGIFDSGSGGLTVLDAARNLLPYENYVYVSDSRQGGWGGLTEAEICERAAACVDKLVLYGCKAVVAACNTATETAIGELREKYDMPIVGVEPAVKPAREAYPDGRIIVLCTPATARQKKFADLLRAYGRRKITVLAQPTLARRIEANLHNLDALRDEPEHILGGESFDAVVLGCTHYVFLRRYFEEFAGAEHVFDGNAGTARRLAELLKEADLSNDCTRMGEVVFDAI